MTFKDLFIVAPVVLKSFVIDQTPSQKYYLQANISYIKKFLFVDAYVDSNYVVNELCAMQIINALAVFKKSFTCT